MIKPNFSADVKPLLAWEIDDFDTQSYKLYGEHPTGINDGRMRLPTRYDIAKFYKRYKKTIGKKRAGEYGTWEKKKKEDLPNISKDFEWQITYSFPSTLHNNRTETGKKYGGETVTYRRLYLILCERFNGGNYFVDDYFNTIYKYTIKPRIDYELNKLKTDLINYASDMLEPYENDDGSMKRGYKKVIKEYEAFAKEWEDTVSPDLAKLIKEDIIASLATGAIPLSHINSAETIRRRHKAGITNDFVFYAVGDLIEHIQLFLTIGGNKKWSTKQGILV